MDKILRETLLYDFYGMLLSDKQRAFYELYFFNDLSLGEIAEQMSITPQGVSDAIRRSVNILENYESKLALLRKYIDREKDIENILRDIDIITMAINDDVQAAEHAKIKERIKGLLD